MTTTGAEITGIIEGSPAGKAGIKKRDILVSIEGHTIRDILDYLYLSSGTRFTVEIERDSVRKRITIRKSDYDALGMRFDAEIFDSMKLCRNRCPFCFVDQVPPGMRETLRLKDDDFRLSFLNGNFISLTNLAGKDWDKIRNYSLSPLYISVHSTNPALRRKIFGHKAAGDIMDILRSFADWNIRIHTQVVLCPGINDGEELERTVTELSDFYPTVQSIAIVPVGVTRHLPSPAAIRPLTAGEMRMVISKSHLWRQAFKKRCNDFLLYLGDEFFTKTGVPIPPISYYGDFPQIENGVGMVRKMLTDFNRRKGRLGSVSPPAASISIITGKSAGPYLASVTQPFRERGFSIKVHHVTNRFWGPDVDVAGLLTGADMLFTMEEEGAGDYIIIPTLSLKDNYLCLDDLTVEDIEARTGSTVIPVDPSFGALKEALLQIAGFPHECGIKGKAGKNSNKV